MGLAGEHVVVVQVGFAEGEVLVHNVRTTSALTETRSRS